MSIRSKRKIEDRWRDQTASILTPYTTRAHFKEEVVMCRNDHIKKKVLQHIRVSLAVVQGKRQVFLTKECYYSFRTLQRSSTMYKRLNLLQIPPGEDSTGLQSRQRGCWDLSGKKHMESLSRQPTRLFHPWDFPGRSTGVGCHCLLVYSLWIGIETSTQN